MIAKTADRFSRSDWAALYFAHTLLVQVAQFGKPALDTFLAAMDQRVK